jgi:hypothetical protein
LFESPVQNEAALDIGIALFAVQAISRGKHMDFVTPLLQERCDGLAAKIEGARVQRWKKIYNDQYPHNFPNP